MRLLRVIWFGLALHFKMLSRSPFDLWVVQDLNPDGLAAGTRQNAHGVDLNRNFGAMWKRIGRHGTFAYSGPRPWSERETRIARSLVLRIHPQVTIWFHQPQAIVRAWGRSIPTARCALVSPSTNRNGPRSTPWSWRGGADRSDRRPSRR